MEIELDSAPRDQPGNTHMSGSTSLAKTTTAGAVSRRTFAGGDDTDSQTSDEAVLARFGKKQQLKRRFKSLSTIGLTSSLMLTWEVVVFTLQFGLSNGGPASVIFGFIGAWIGALIQVVVMAEIASMIPLAGGAFNWVAILAPSRYRKFLSYVAGWLTVITYQLFVADVCFVCASLIQALAVLNYPAYEAKLWHATLIYYGVLFTCLFVNTYLGILLPRIEALVLMFYIMGFFGVLVPLVYLSEHRSASDVFGTFLNLGGYSSNGVAFLVGWLTSFGSFLGADGSDHMAEEVEQAATVVPFTMWVSIVLNGSLGFGILLATLFATPDYVAAVKSPTGFPIIDIFNSVMGLGGATALIAIMTAVNVFSVSSIMATASRTLWAFSRENGLPLSKQLAMVDRKTRLPYNAIVATIFVSLLVGLITLGSTAAFQALVSVVVTAYYSTYLLAASVMLHKRLTTARSELPWGPFTLGSWGLPLNIIAIMYTIVITIFSFFPAEVPVTAASMNYNVAIYGVAALLMLGFWVFHARKVYVGPIWEFDEGFTRKN